MKTINNRTCFRILKKTKEGLTIESAKHQFDSTLPEQEEISWDDFNEFFEIVDNVWFITKLEIQKKEQERYDFVKQALPFLLIKSPNLTDLAMIGSYAKEYCKKFPGETPQDFIQIAQLWKIQLQKSFSKYETNGDLTEKVPENNQEPKSGYFPFKNLKKGVSK
jgi:hypothetical protein